uniref:FF domain-containing protein n=1 Tax=Eutreptiella gymnastica TaxID=73025 RepID=A0A6U7U082_9EUGL|mmetsp:Transcript_117997/g.205432  ORF Transcript_117997/g.205432 Transcript_117997/m.205432 type:complete len:507 (+) Transcript_117997:28-1548(+)
MKDIGPMFGAPDAKAVHTFRELLRDKKVDPNSTWREELPKLVCDKRYDVLTVTERRKIFDHYVQELRDRQAAKAARKYASSGDESADDHGNGSTNGLDRSTSRSTSRSASRSTSRSSSRSSWHSSRRSVHSQANSESEMSSRSLSRGASAESSDRGPSIESSGQTSSTESPVRTKVRSTKKKKPVRRPQSPEGARKRISKAKRIPDPMKQKHRTKQLDQPKATKSADKRSKKSPRKMRRSSVQLDVKERPRKHETSSRHTTDVALDRSATSSRHSRHHRKRASSPLERVYTPLKVAELHSDDMEEGGPSGLSSWEPASMRRSLLPESIESIKAITADRQKRKRSPIEDLQTHQKRARIPDFVETPTDEPGRWVSGHDDRLLDVDEVGSPPRSELTSRQEPPTGRRLQLSRAPRGPMTARGDSYRGNAHDEGYRGVRYENSSVRVELRNEGDDFDAPRHRRHVMVDAEEGAIRPRRHLTLGHRAALKQRDPVVHRRFVVKRANEMDS